MPDPWLILSAGAPNRRPTPPAFPWADMAMRSAFTSRAYCWMMWDTGPFAASTQVETSTPEAASARATPAR